MASVFFGLGRSVDDRPPAVRSSVRGGAERFGVWKDTGSWVLLGRSCVAWPILVPPADEKIDSDGGSGIETTDCGTCRAGNGCVAG